MKLLASFAVTLATLLIGTALAAPGPAKFPSISLGGHTNIISDNGTAMTYNGVVIGGGGGSGSTNWVDSAGTNATLVGVAGVGSLAATHGATLNDMLLIQVTNTFSNLGYNIGLVVYDPLFDNNGGSIVDNFPQATNAFGVIAESGAGGLVIEGYSDANSDSPLYILASRIANSTNNNAAIRLFAQESYSLGNAWQNQTIFGVDNDGSFENSGHYMFNVFESHGTYSGGFADSAAYVGVNAGLPLAVLHVINPTTLNDTNAKTNVISLFEGRSDQTGDLAQWKLTGGSSLAKIDKAGVITSVGVTDASSASSGNVGEFISSLVASGSAITLTNASAWNVTSISLTAGDWDVEGNINFSATTATITGTQGGISIASATLPTDGSEVYSGVQVTLLSEKDSVTLPRKRVNVSTTTVVYLVAKSTFSAGSVTGFGSISARRIR